MLEINVAITITEATRSILVISGLLPTTYYKVKVGEEAKVYRLGWPVPLQQATEVFKLWNDLPKTRISLGLE